MFPKSTPKTICPQCGERKHYSASLCDMCLDRLPGPNPSGLCQCGCGRKTRLADQSDTQRGNIKGKPVRFIYGHHLRPMNIARTTRPEDNYIVSPHTGCWEWQGYCNPRGYGTVEQRGIRRTPAHRYMYEQRYGPVDSRLDIDHLCRNPSCVNPDHLEAVTHAENARRGAKAKLTHDDVREIRRLHPQVSYKQLATRFKISETQIYRILAREQWADI